MAAVERELYDVRSLVRMLGMRRTMWVVPVELAAVVHGACTRAIEVRERNRLVQYLAEAGVVDADEGHAWLAEVEEATMEALGAAGEGGATAAELSPAVAGLRERLHLARGHQVGGGAGVVDPGAVRAGRVGTDRAGPAAGVVDQLPVPVVDDGVVAARRAWTGG